MFTELLAKRLLRIADEREPDEIIGPRETPYMLRWWIVRKPPYCNVYLHKFMRSDDERALHDHPWTNASILLKGSYIEHLKTGPVVRCPGAIYFRRAHKAHRVQLFPYVDVGTHIVSNTEMPVWTLFLTGPKVREWGFLCPRGWTHWKEYTAVVDGANVVGRGCDD
jgi:hypothetical protein